MPPTCIIADDHFVVREGLRVRLEDDGWVDVVGEAARGEDTLELIRDKQPDLALVDLRMPGMDGIQVTAAARDEGLATRVIIFSALTDSSLLQRAFAHGAAGYVAKEAPPDVFLRALHHVHEGRRFIDPVLAADMLDAPSERLSDREYEILVLLSKGSSNAGIAETLGVAVETIKSHVSNILVKLGAESRTQAVAIALRRSLIE